MDRSLNIEIINEEAISLLQGMERLRLIYVRETMPKKINWSEKYRGAMSKQPIREIDQQLDNLRNAWE
jgi:hypothetical protein